MSVRLAGGLYLIERIKKQASEAGGRTLQELTDGLARRLNIGRTVVLMVSDKVATPAAVGLFRAVILFPASAITKLSPEDIEALLAHELAHIRRYDYFVNLSQSVVETVLFYHPCVWWISNVVRTEREHCCDDLALYALGDRDQYARALLGLEQSRQAAPRLAMAANRGQLLARIHRILVLEQPRMVPASIWVNLTLDRYVLTMRAGFKHLTFQSRKAKRIQTPKQFNRESGSRATVIDENGRPVAGAQRVLYQPDEL